MTFVLVLLEILFILFMLGSILLYVFVLNITWTWAQHHLSTQPSFREILSLAAIEWGAIISLEFSHLFRMKIFFEAPPIAQSDVTPQQLPVVFVPSLHTGAGIFNFLFWRLKKNFWNSLWPFRWKPFLNQPELLVDQLRQYIQNVIERTKTNRFRIVSFGSSRPIVSRLLDDQKLSIYCDKWIAISSPAQLSAPLELLSTRKLKLAYRKSENLERNPDLLIVGENDFWCYPDKVWGNSKRISLSRVGHFGTLLHSTTTQNVLKELSTT